MLRRALRSLLFLTIILIAAAAFAATDEDTCTKRQGEASIAACGRLILSGKFASTDLATIYVLQATTYRNSGDYAHAIADFTQAIELLQKSAVADVVAAAYVARASALSLNGDLKSALADYRKALGLDPGNSQAAEGIKFTEAAIAASKRAAVAFKECDYCSEMVVVPAGNFIMGSPASEIGRDKDEGPQQPVTIERSFAVGKFEVTVAQYKVFADETGQPVDNCDMWVITDTAPNAPGFPQDGSHPAVCISWDDAKAYTAWLSRKVGKEYRLLTEAEWEYAARAGTTSRFYFGDDDGQICNYANSADQPHRKFVPGAAKCRDGYIYTAPVGTFAPNAFGLYDMLGNAWEWVEDCAHDNYKDMPAATKQTGAAWTNENCTSRIMRGGGWSNPPNLLRSAQRFRWSNIKPDFRNNRIGFRVARTLTE
jgi:formylglycine-generating enzyme required for sulfatase activity